MFLRSLLLAAVATAVAAAAVALPVTDCYLGGTPTSAVESCTDTWAACNATDVLVWVSPRGWADAPFLAQCGYDGWTLTAKLNGSTPGGGAFGYHSLLWTNAALLNDDVTLLSIVNEAKLQPFTAMPVVALRIAFTLVNGSGGPPLDVLPAQGDPPYDYSSLAAFFTGGQRATGSPRADWVGVLPGGAASQPLCNQQGVNMANTIDPFGMVMYFRVGIVFNNDASCNGGDTALGVGANVENQPYSAVSWASGWPQWDIQCGEPPCLTLTPLAWLWVRAPAGGPYPPPPSATPAPSESSTASAHGTSTASSTASASRTEAVAAGGGTTDAVFGPALAGGLVGSLLAAVLVGAAVFATLLWRRRYSPHAKTMSPVVFTSASTDSSNVSSSVNPLVGLAQGDKTRLTNWSEK